MDINKMDKLSFISVMAELDISREQLMVLRKRLIREGNSRKRRSLIGRISYYKKAADKLFELYKEHRNRISNVNQ